MNERDFMRTCPSARVVSRDALLPGYRLVFNGFSNTRQGGVANIQGRPGGMVRGVLWDVPLREWTALDRREGAPHMYKRIPVTVWANRAWRMAQTYKLTHPLPFEVAPSEAYARLMLKGIEDPAYRERVAQHMKALMA